MPLKVNFLMFPPFGYNLSRGANGPILGRSFIFWVRLENVFGAPSALVVAPMPELSTFGYE